ncbi:calpain-2 catalytic subunit-like isoform X2 [Xiphophorus couchianus]|uniref:calpain-2 catalytic subunit-like isoform X2 n=1 Tax=Xiphophorus couchianus TaxID=32473 RepID=UPI001015F6E6|nr:calpain-2 catalytic subunit-like isoform X2 [Xiphophorus couchianus]
MQNLGSDSGSDLRLSDLSPNQEGNSFYFGGPALTWQQVAPRSWHHSPGTGLGRFQAVRYLDQDYEALKRRCLETGRLFPALGSLGVNELGPNSYKVRGVSWQRPTVSSDSVQFIRTEIGPGQIGPAGMRGAPDHPEPDPDHRPL